MWIGFLDMAGLDLPELAGIEVTPLARGPAIDLRPLGGVGGVAQKM